MLECETWEDTRGAWEKRGSRKKGSTKIGLFTIPGVGTGGLKYSRGVKQRGKRSGAKVSDDSKMTPKKEGYSRPGNV